MSTKKSPSSEDADNQQGLFGNCRSRPLTRSGFCVNVGYSIINFDRRPLYGCGKWLAYLLLLLPVVHDGHSTPYDKSNYSHTFPNKDEVIVSKRKLSNGCSVYDAVHGIGIHRGVDDVLGSMSTSSPSNSF